MAATYYVHVLGSTSRTLYTSVTNDIARRLHEHRSGVASAFTRRYSVHRLVHVETSSNSRDAIARETQIERWTRKKKVALIEANNPEWRELSPRMRPDRWRVSPAHLDGKPVSRR